MEDGKQSEEIPEDINIEPDKNETNNNSNNLNSHSNSNYGLNSNKKNLQKKEIDQEVLIQIKNQTKMEKIKISLKKRNLS